MKWREVRGGVDWRWPLVWISRLGSGGMHYTIRVLDLRGLNLRRDLTSWDLGNAESPTQWLGFSDLSGTCITSEHA